MHERMSRPSVGSPPVPQQEDDWLPCPRAPVWRGGRWAGSLLSATLVTLLYFLICHGCRLRFPGFSG